MLSSTSFSRLPNSAPLQHDLVFLDKNAEGGGEKEENYQSELKEVSLV